jgi:hypothetical protein
LQYNCGVVIALWLLRRGYCVVVIAAWLLRCGYCGVVIALWLLRRGYCVVVIAAWLLRSSDHFSNRMESFGLMNFMMIRVSFYSTFNLKDFAIMWLHARSCVAILCRTPAYGLYDCASDIAIL